MFPITLLPISFLCLIAYLAYNDFKEMQVPKVPTIIGSTIVLGIWMIALSYAPTTFIFVGIIGVIMFIALRFAKVFKMQEFRTFDQIFILFSFIILPFITLFAVILMQALMVARAKISGSQTIALMPMYLISYIFSFMIITLFVGGGVGYI